MEGSTQQWLWPLWMLIDFQTFFVFEHFHKNNHLSVYAFPFARYFISHLLNFIPQKHIEALLGAELQRHTPWLGKTQERLLVQDPRGGKETVFQQKEWLMECSAIWKEKWGGAVRESENKLVCLTRSMGRQWMWRMRRREKVSRGELMQGIPYHAEESELYPILMGGGGWIFNKRVRGDLIKVLKISLWPQWGERIGKKQIWRQEELLVIWLLFWFKQELKKVWDKGEAVVMKKKGQSSEMDILGEARTTCIKPYTSHREILLKSGNLNYRGSHH